MKTYGYCKKRKVRKSIGDDQKSGGRISILSVAMNPNNIRANEGLD